MPKDFTDQVLSDVEKSALTAFADNAIAMGAVKKILLAAGYHNGTLRAGAENAADPTRNAALALAFEKGFTNEQLGQDIRALAEAVRLVESGFKTLDKYKSPPKPGKPAGNKAR